MNEYPNPEAIHYARTYINDTRTARIYKKLSTDSRLDDEDRTQIERAAKQYKLNPYLKNMMYAIRLAEGTKTFGVQGKIDSTDNTPRDMTDYADNTAGSLDKNWNNRWDKKQHFITQFGNRWCPTEGKNLTDAERKLNPYWQPNVRTLMEENNEQDDIFLRSAR